MANTKVDKVNVSNDPFAQKPLLQGKDNQQQLIKLDNQVFDWFTSLA
ncbi:MAG: hypothetical protein GY782_11130 [Gammaproteobacteria bacterium]|nr:hypothetical protein [Gammaproteobacteria bacterium]